MRKGGPVPIKLTIGEVAVAGSRFPGIYIEIGGKRYLFGGTDASRIGRELADSARSAVSRVDIDVLRETVAECEVELCADK